MRRFTVLNQVQVGNVTFNRGNLLIANQKGNQLGMYLIASPDKPDEQTVEASSIELAELVQKKQLEEIR